MECSILALERVQKLELNFLKGYIYNYEYNNQENFK